MTDNKLSRDLSEHFPKGFLERYKDSFIYPAFKAPFGIQTLKQTRQRKWHTETQPGTYLVDDKLKKHLNGEYYVASAAYFSTRCITIDVDSGRYWRSLYKRADQVQKVFSKATPLVFSTPRKGLHLKYLLEQEVQSKQAVAFAKDLFDEAGIDLKPGQYELFPSGKKLLRAPLGRDCFLIDPFTYKPVSSDRSDNFCALDNLLQENNTDRLIVPDDYPTINTSSQFRDGFRGKRGYSDNEFMQGIDELLKIGLTQPAQRNDACLKLCWHMRTICQYDEETTIQELWTWMQEYHNGYSSEFNKNPPKVYQKIQEVVKHFDPSKASNNNTYHKPQANPQRDNEKKNAQINCPIPSPPLEDPDKNLYDNILNYAHKRGQDGEDGFINVEIPSRTLQSWYWRYKPILQRLIDRDYLKKGKNYTTRGRCQTYRIPNNVLVPHNALTF